MSDDEIRSQERPDAITLLTMQHRKAKSLFEKFDKIKEEENAEEKYALAQQVCAELLIHMEIEEKIFYPAMREKIEEDQVNEALIEHQSAKELIEQLGQIKPTDPMFAARVTVLSEQIDHHVKEEESEMFPEARKKKLDLAELGQQLQSAANRLRRQHGMQPE